MNSDIFLSFIVPVSNSEKTLSACLDSILLQTPKNFEIIIVNDKSTDNSRAIIDKYEQSFPDFIKAYNKETGGGPGDTRNYGIKKSNGRYIAFVDSDDTISTNYLAIVKDIIDKHKSDMVIISYNRIYNRTRNIFERYHKFNKWDKYDFPFDLATMPDVICKVEVASWLKILKRELFLKK
jgi:glycosyltransferase involved in cell wall biosynthesis